MELIGKNWGVGKMSKYAKLKSMKDNFIHAATNTDPKSHFMIALWITRAEDVQRQIDKLSLENAMEEC